MKELKKQRNSLKEDHSKAQERNRKALADMENKYANLKCSVTVVCSGLFALRSTLAKCNPY